MGCELLCKRGCYGSTELAIVVPTRCWRELFLYRQRCFRNSPGPRSALRPKRVTLRATQGFAPTGVRELIQQDVGPNEKIKRGQIKLTESKISFLSSSESGMACISFRIVAGSGSFSARKSLPIHQRRSHQRFARVMTQRNGALPLGQLGKNGAKVVCGGLAGQGYSDLPAM
jgi:hypothetical protein